MVTGKPSEKIPIWVKELLNMCWSEALNEFQTTLNS
jgi:hypothetical protein